MAQEIEIYVVVKFWMGEIGDVPILQEAYSSKEDAEREARAWAGECGHKFLEIGERPTENLETYVQVHRCTLK